LPAERATGSWSREIPRPSGGQPRGTALAPGTCVVLGWPGNDTPVPPGGRRAAGKKASRQTGPHNLLGRWATWPPPAEEPR
jgi:hypothetical protein